MTVIAPLTLAVSVGLVGYAYIGYPVILKLLAMGRPRRPAPGTGGAWPLVSITIPVYNAGAGLARTLQCLVDLDYPAARRQILVVSDASTDESDAIAASFAARGVEVLRMPHRAGKGAAENAARSLLRGEIVVSTDATVQVQPGALKALVRAFADPTVGLASGQDVSVGSDDVPANRGEAAYVDYEMRIRDLETRVSGIVGASGCLYAIRADLHHERVPEDLSRDFAAALIARRRGWRAVSVPDAVCLVRRSGSLETEYRRKVRTMARGLRTLWYLRALLNPARYGAFAWMLLSHKLCRWLVPWAGVAALGAMAALAIDQWWARGAFALAGCGAACAVIGWVWRGSRPPRLCALAAYGLGSMVAGLEAWRLAAGGARFAMWEPTRRATDSRAASP